MPKHTSSTKRSSEVEFGRRESLETEEKGFSRRNILLGLNKLQRELCQKSTKGVCPELRKPKEGKGIRNRVSLLGLVRKGDRRGKIPPGTLEQKNMYVITNRKEKKKERGFSKEEKRNGASTFMTKSVDVFDII